MENRNIKAELLAPAGDEECLLSALDYGADAVYLAGKTFGMRAGAKNFGTEELFRAVQTAHERGVKVYITCNTTKPSAFPSLYAPRKNAEWTRSSRRISGSSR